VTTLGATTFAWLLLFLTVLTPRCPAQSGDPSHSPSKAEVASYTGCYQLTVGRWWPWSFGEDTKYVTPPNRIELSPDLGTEGFGKDHLLIRVVPAVPAQKITVSGGRGASFWEVQPSNRVNLFWTDGFTGVTLKLKKQGYELLGWAYPHFDAVPLIPRIARVKAKLIPCK
jgi:hypothetical protein